MEQLLEQLAEQCCKLEPRFNQYGGRPIDYVAHFDGSRAEALISGYNLERSDDYEQLWRAFKSLVWEIDEHADFRNGNTDGTVDEGQVHHVQRLEHLHELLLKARYEILSSLNGDAAIAAAARKDA